MKKILVIDDDGQMLKTSFWRLEEHGIELVYAESEQQSVDIIAKQAIDVLLMDGNLCADRNGVDVVKTLRANGVKTRIIMFSNDEKLNAAGIDAGADGSWNKNMLYEDGWVKNLLVTLG
jgi:DNA-binding response OmpR family regulator